MNKFKCICAFMSLCIMLTIVSCSDPNESDEKETTIISPTSLSEVEIDSTEDWIAFAADFNKRGDEYDKNIKVNVNVSLNFENSDNYKLGTQDIPFSGEIDFNGESIVYSDCLIKNASNIKVSNLHLFQGESKRVYGPLIRSCSENADLRNIVINSINDNSGYGSLFFYASTLVQSGNKIKITDVSLYDVIVSGYDNVSGLVGECGTLEINNLSMNSVTVQALSGYLVTDAGLVVRNAKELIMKDCKFSRSFVSALHYASGCAVECENLSVTNVIYSDCYISTFPTPTMPSSASGLVWRGLSEFTEKNLTFSNVVLNVYDEVNEASSIGYITADKQNKYYNYEVISK